MTHVRWMVQWSYVIVLQYPSSVEQMHKAAVRVGIEMIDHRANFVLKRAALNIGISHSTKALPKCEKDDLGFGVLVVDFVDELNVGCGEFGRGDVIHRISIVCAWRKSERYQDSWNRLSIPRLMTTMSDF